MYQQCTHCTESERNKGLVGASGSNFCPGPSWQINLTMHISHSSFCLKKDFQAPVADEDGDEQYELKTLSAFKINVPSEMFG